MSTAYLDSQRNYGDRTGNVSDPRLVTQVDRIHPLTNTPEELEAAGLQVLAHARDRREHATLTAMIFPPLQEAA